MSYATMNMSITHLAYVGEISTRLANCARNEGIKTVRELKACLEAPGGRRKMLNHQNCGRRTVDEMEWLIKSVVKQPAPSNREEPRIYIFGRCIAAHYMHEAGFTYRKIGKFFGLSGQRASDLAWRGEYFIKAKDHLRKHY